ncbi:hypothetical protein A2715_04645 [Candidatus Woesebacteria bacterium RIFCSPHIGHO2_01_FULL_39_32]|uniref:Glycosyltransferase 2-like domain-containing protein n=1 Tax=Candidatus Woesebacteria bacterium RIFCSPLOWO2_01_FULL_39_25 TaxID=1802521 RepID=A0A1F8BL89_9BACT|nr:MAG: hypothetical protein A2124_03180 [Candidatus Woesebacteria bacterium GWB1_37_5]OGM25306.1 MAG: hypothetical protein A2715_04645 [Candidatus Woesebacteria bacterium RIFCSPHIGHO2_01_FULL_39_32]OGM37805.1 MAG: hypothetical protein A3F01_01855 [Candidatus Woesebacteria bacterium RIFCSPHIGHO2_12_FULL_38_11]OGM64837.1 MAG: hypothetical protein A2893_04255 [Candidatus Woesebacteria bacterium RIFCSPLOWO2_01_FULL_39_25]
MEKIFLSVIIPCYNEEENLKRNVLSEVHDFLKNKVFSWEVIISDDGSTDGSKDLIKSQIKGWKNFRLLENPHGGKPSALWFGIKSAKGEYVLFSDMDQSTPIDQLGKLLPFLAKNIGAVIGSRGLLRKNFPLYRRIGSIVFMAVRKLFILPEIDDTQCGFKLFRKEVALRSFPKLEFFRKEKRVKGWTVTSWDVELLHIIKKIDFRIEEVPVQWKDIDVSKSKGGVFGRYARESKEMLTQILRVKLNDLKGLYKDV